MMGRLLALSLGMIAAALASVANGDTLTFSGSQGNGQNQVSASGTADFTFSAGELQITLTNTTPMPNQITQAIEGIKWSYTTSVGGSISSYGATVTPIDTINSNGGYTLGSPRAVDESGNGWQATVASLGTSNMDMIVDVPISTSPNGSLTNNNGPTEVLSPVTFTLFSSAFTSNLAIKSATMVWGTGGLNAPEISDTEKPAPPAAVPLPRTAEMGMALVLCLGLSLAAGRLGRRHRAG